MKRIAFFLALLPAFAFAQNITNTLGTSGTFIVEDVTFNSVFRASRVTSAPLVNIGDWTSGFSLPAGNVNMSYNNAASSTFITNITVGNGNSNLAKPTLQFNYTPGPLTAPTDVLAASTLGVIGYGGYLSSSWRTNAAKIQVDVDGTPAGTNIPTKFTFSTQTSAGVAKNMVLNSGGNLIVDASITSKAIVSKNANYTATADDQTIVCTTSGITITLPAVAANVGKIYTIKKGANGNFTITVDANGAETIDGAATVVFGTNANYEFLTLQSDGAAWWIISRGN